MPHPRRSPPQPASRRRAPHGSTGRPSERSTPGGHASIHAESADDETVQGLRAGLAIFAKRKDDIRRIAFSRAVRTEVLELCRWAASQRLSCHEVSEGELERIAGNSHHEGLCVLARTRPWLGVAELAERLVQRRGTCIALDRVRNPYNVGAILRSSAFFGVDAALLGAPAPHPGLPPTAVRVAEGGVEHVALARTTDLADTLGRLRSRGVRVIGTDSLSPSNVLDYAFERPTVVVLGNEREGLGERVRAQCDATVAINGCGAVQSLNVAVAAGVVLSRMTA